MIRKIFLAGSLSFLFSMGIFAQNPKNLPIEILQKEQPTMPLLTKKENVLAKLQFSVKEQTNIDALSVAISSELKRSDLKKIRIYFSEENKMDKAVLFGETSKIGKLTKVKGAFLAKENTKIFVWIKATISEKPNLLNKIKVDFVTISSENSSEKITDFTGEAQRMGITLRQTNQDNVKCYRIPGMVTTNKGTLIAVYDNRYNNCKDLQENIDIGMSRSTDGGKSWQPMKVIMDMKQHNGFAEELNGVGDPAILVDKKTGTIWVVALWLQGHSKDKMAWWASKPGMTPAETGQLLLVKSEDDGRSWSEPINITLQTKNPKWHLFFNGPGAGISLEDGKIMFAAQYKDENQVPHSTLIYSDDHGKSWHTGTGAKSHTTEAQVVQLSNGDIMLNMRDDRNRDNKDNLFGRSVAITSDFGKTWTEHATSRSSQLIEPNCMASIISYKKNNKPYLFFSNPADAKKRINMTIKASDDDGLSWNKLPQITIFQDGSFGYSCMSIIDNKYIGIIYEGSGDLYFQKIPVSEFIR